MPTSESDHSSRVVVVTGGGSGIGKEIARAFHDHGDRVVVCGRRADPLAAAAAEIGPRVTWHTCDVGDAASVRELVDAVAREHGRIDVLVNNAGVYGPIGPAHENPVEEWLDAVRIDLCSVFLATRFAAPLMIAQGGGAIVNVSGGGATAPKPCYSAYAAAKAGVVRFTETAALELAEHGVRVNAIAPGFVVTRFHDLTLAAGELAGPELQATRKKLDEGGDDPRHAAELAVLLAGPEADGITGRLISAIFDDWRTPEGREAIRAAKSLFTLRRIDDFMFQQIPEETRRQ